MSLQFHLHRDQLPTRERGRERGREGEEKGGKEGERESEGERGRGREREGGEIEREREGEKGREREGEREREAPPPLPPSRIHRNVPCGSALFTSHFSQSSCSHPALRRRSALRGGGIPAGAERTGNESDDEVPGWPRDAKPGWEGAGLRAAWRDQTPREEAETRCPLPGSQVRTQAGQSAARIVQFITWEE